MLNKFAIIAIALGLVAGLVQNVAGGQWSGRDFPDPAIEVAALDRRAADAAAEAQEYRSRRKAQENAQRAVQAPPSTDFKKLLED